MVDQTRQQEIIDSFAALRRRKTIPQMLCRLSVAAIPVYLLVYTRLRDTSNGLGWLEYGLVALVAVAVGAAFWGYSGWRCPACRSDLKGADPKYCSECGQRLKPL